MTTIAQLRLSGEGVACRGAFERCPGLECELEPVVAGGIGLRVTGAEPGAVETALAAGEDRSLYDVGFAGAFDGLFEAVADHGGTVLGATGGEAAWTVRLRVARREDVRGIHARLTEREFDCEVLRLSDPTPEGGPSGLTDEQHEALVAGVEGGYFEIPRRVSLAELAEEFGISHQALSERFRRAYRTLVSSRLAGDAAATTA